LKEDDPLYLWTFFHTSKMFCGSDCLSPAWQPPPINLTQPHHSCHRTLSRNQVVNLAEVGQSGVGQSSPCFHLVKIQRLNPATGKNPAKPPGRQ
jgi:hypothetical protein